MSLNNQESGGGMTKTLPGISSSRVRDAVYVREPSKCCSAGYDAPTTTIGRLIAPVGDGIVSDFCQAQQQHSASSSEKTAHAPETGYMEKNVGKVDIHSDAKRKSYQPQEMRAAKRVHAENACITSGSSAALNIHFNLSGQQENKRQQKEFKMISSKQTSQQQRRISLPGSIIVPSVQNRAIESAKGLPEGLPSSSSTGGHIQGSNFASENNDDCESHGKGDGGKRDNATNPVSSVSISSEKMKEIFPYHIVVDQRFHIIQYGSKLPNLINRKIRCNQHIERYVVFSCSEAGGLWDWVTLSKFKDRSLVLESTTDEGGKKVKLKANTTVLSDLPKQLMLIISPNAKNVTELSAMDLTMSDLPLHSFQRDVIEVHHKFDKLSKKLTHEKNLSNSLLYSMMPKDVATTLRSGETYEPINHEGVTLFFSDVVGFTKLCAQLSSWDVIDMLNTLYTVMDFLCEKFSLYKLETIGDAYICCSGLPEEDERHAEYVANFALAVQRCVNLVKSPLTGQPIRLRMGIHTGNCMSGVVGNLTPKYTLFGDMINTASRHESTGEPGMIQVSNVTYGQLTCASKDSSNHYRWIPRGLVEMKGKGKLFTYWLHGGAKANPFVNSEALRLIEEEVKNHLATNTWKKRKYFERERRNSDSSISVNSAVFSSANADELSKIREQVSKLEWKYKSLKTPHRRSSI